VPKIGLRWQPIARQLTLRTSYSEGFREPSLYELLWTAAAARLVLGAEMNIQAPPNLSYGDFPRLLEAGINDWGGVSPVTPDHVNPERPWPAPML
jgi:FO synthase